jgi:hypothetical protein
LHLEYETLLLPDGLDRSLVVDVAQHGSPTAEWLVMRYGRATCAA